MRDVEQKQAEGSQSGLSGPFVFTVSFSSTPSTTAFEQAWGLGKGGNWSAFDQDDQGNGAWDLEQTRATNNGNEIVDIGAAVGAVWATPTYDPPGNMVSFPKPGVPTESFRAVYDAWNRLVTVLDGEDVVAEYAYDGRSFRTQKTVGGQDRHYYYNSSWQLLEERLATPTPADLRRQYVWGIGINSLVLRNRDTDDDGVLDERLYALQDSHWDTCAVVGAAGSVVERYEYEAYGKPRLLDPAFGELSASVCAWEVLLQGSAVDAETGLYQIRYRYYHTVLGLWISQDPIEDDSGDVSLFTFAGASPVVAVDPTGLVKILAGRGFYGARTDGWDSAKRQFIAFEDIAAILSNFKGTDKYGDPCILTALNPISRMQLAMYTEYHYGFLWMKFPQFGQKPYLGPGVPSWIDKADFEKAKQPKCGLYYGGSCSAFWAKNGGFRDWVAGQPGTAKPPPNCTSEQAVSLLWLLEKAVDIINSYRCCREWGDKRYYIRLKIVPGPRVVNDENWDAAECGACEMKPPFKCLGEN